VADTLAELSDVATQRHQPWRALSAIVDLRDRLDELEALQVDNAREQGWSWSEIAQPLRVTRQAVHRKHASRVEDARREPRNRRAVLSGEARRCVVRARREAAAFGHDSVGTDHLLLGVIGQKRVASTLAPLGLTLERALFAVTDLRGLSDARLKVAGRAEPIPISEKARGVLDQSVREAVRRGDEAVRAEHLLLALLRDGDCAARRVFAHAGIDPAKVEKRLREVARS
jgi:Clp amino terminal domain, pathogenicity island component